MLLDTSSIEKGGGHGDEVPQDWQWLILDGPVDTLWVENLNTVLDDSKLLCLANGERIGLTMGMRLLFEVDNLSQASPATISRCAMVYLVSHLLFFFVNTPQHSKWINQSGAGGEISQKFHGTFGPLVLKTFRALNFFFFSGPDSIFLISCIHQVLK